MTWLEHASRTAAISPARIQPGRAPAEKPATRTIRIYLAEEQQILRHAYQSFFQTNPGLEIVGTCGHTSAEALVAAATALKPTVLVLGTKVLQPTVVEKLEALRQNCPETAVVLLSASYDVKGIKALREFSRRRTRGCAYLLKHTIDTVSQLTQVVQSVAEGRIILDPAVMEGLIAAAESKSTFLRELSPRELEVLSWMAKGFRNKTIAEVLCLERTTVACHINHIYGKMGTIPDERHARVHAVTLYLRATGLLLAEDFSQAA
jgi:two-component system nitrate/nitrite response regulator NarL